nr:T9SS type A sorting domain-containing protein [Ignavibacteriaceae bacterium]
ISDFGLEQNYPNPFNPSTTIKYSISENGFVKLSVYNLLGEEVTTLVNNEQKAGRYEVNFNAKELSSGIYMYRLESNNFLSIKKMILIK